MSDDAKAEWVARVLGVDVIAPPIPNAKALTFRLAGLANKVKALGNPKDMLDDLRAAGSALKGDDVGLANGLMDEIEARLASRERAGEAAAEIAAGDVPPEKDPAIAKLRKAWSATRVARDRALDNMFKVCTDYLSDPEAAEDVQFDEVEAKAQEIGDMMPIPPTDIDDAIQAMVTTDQKRRDAARTMARAALAKFRAELDEEPALKDLQALGNYPIYDLVTKAVDALDAALDA
jgi:hypothetical protein